MARGGMKESKQESKGGEKERVGRDNQKTDWGDQGETKEEVRGRNKGGGGGQQATVREGGEGGSKGKGVLVGWFTEAFWDVWGREGGRINNKGGMGKTTQNQGGKKGEGEEKKTTRKEAD